MTLLWIIAGLFIAALLYWFVIPYLRIKITLFYLSYKIQKMVKKKNGDLRKQLFGLSKTIKDAAKSEKL